MEGILTEQDGSGTVEGSMDELAYRLSVGCAVPFVLALIGILGKKVSRGKGGGWKRSDCYLGAEFTLAGIATGLTSLFDLHHKWVGPKKIVPEPSIFLCNSLVPFLGMFLFVFVLSLNLQYDNPANAGAVRSTELRMLAGVANGIGFVVLLAGLAFMPV